MEPDTVLDSEEARERRFWGQFLRVLWTALLLIGVLVALVTATVLLGWGRYVVLAILGVLAGSAVTLAVLGSPRSRGVTGLVLGAFTFPVLAVHLGAAAERGEAEFAIHATTLLPFLAWGAAVAVVVPALVRIWRPRPEAAGEGAKGGSP